MRNLFNGLELLKMNYCRLGIIEEEEEEEEEEKKLCY
jgi:hypothetical protein